MVVDKVHRSTQIVIIFSFFGLSELKWFKKQVRV